MNAQKLISFLDKYVSEDGHSVYDPFRLREVDATKLDVNDAAAFIENALETRLEFEEEIGKNDKAIASRYLNEFRANDELRKNACSIFIKQAKAIYTQN